MTKTSANTARILPDAASTHFSRSCADQRAPISLVPADPVGSCASDNANLNDIAIKRGMARKEFFLAYQPQFAIGYGGQALSGVEALLRWNHPKLGLLTPSQFMHSVDSAELECDLGAYVLRTAVEQVRTWLDTAGRSPRVAINLAAQQLDSPALCKNVLNALGVSGVEARFLKVEIIESPVILNASQTASQLRRLRDAGVTVAIDDFGTGSASFHYLLQFPFDSIKICAEFIQGIGCGTGADEICQAIIQLGRSLAKHVVAEGVETKQQLEFLRKHRCDEVQGFLLGRPVTGEAFADLFMGCAYSRPAS